MTPHPSESHPISLLPGWGSIPVFFPPGLQVTRVSPYLRGPFPSKEIRRISERDDPGPPVVPGGWGSVWDSEPSKSGSLIGADRQRFGLSCVLLNACHEAERRVGV